ncbi:MAG: glycosyltransferase [Candidatus Aegiribacteria sp.]|nr:glycosyltransferase [Candidatus Aegiribacteria sp.]
MSEGRNEALLVTPLPPLKTGLATYALRVLENTLNLVNWMVAYTPGSNPSLLPPGVRSLPLNDLEEHYLPNARIFQVGNSEHCFPVVQALYEFSGTALFHETVIHHMLRHCYLERNRWEDYRRELRFCYGPAAEAVEKDLSNGNIPAAQYDRKLKKYSLIGRALHASHSAVCLNKYAACILGGSYPEGGILTIGHPLSPLPELKLPSKPFPLCFGMIGTNHYGRNLLKIIEAVKLLRVDYPDAGLILIGGNYPDELPRWVRRTGRLENEEYQSWIRILDYVFDVRYPTCGETSGSLLEAMRAGIPSIVTATGAFNNIPSDAVIRVPPDSIVQGIRSAVLLLEGRPGLRNTLSLKGAAYAEDTGSEERLLSDWKRVLQLANQPPANSDDMDSHTSISPAWHKPQAGFTRDLNTAPVTWKFSGIAELEGPECAEGALVTAWGDGTVGSVKLENEPSVISLDGRTLRFSGNGWVSNVTWQ